MFPLLDNSKGGFCELGHYFIFGGFWPPWAARPTQGRNFSPPGLGNWFPDGRRNFRNSRKLQKKFRILGRESAHGGPRALLGSEGGVLGARETLLWRQNDIQAAQCVYCRHWKAPNDKKEFKFELLQPRRNLRPAKPDVGHERLLQKPTTIPAS